MNTMKTTLLTRRCNQEATPSLLPVTERLLAKLPGKRWLWVMLWSLVPVVRVWVIVPMITNSGLNPLGWEFLWMALIEVLVWSVLSGCLSGGSTSLPKMCFALEPNLSHLLGKHRYTTRYAFRGMESTLGPLLLTVLLMLIFEHQVHRWWILDTSTRQSSLRASKLFPAYSLVLELHDINDWTQPPWQTTSRT